ncbi:MAG: FkbM family methyltransferase [Rhodospirillaceae bacterium]
MRPDPHVPPFTLTSAASDQPQPHLARLIAWAQPEALPLVIIDHGAREAFTETRWRRLEPGRIVVHCFDPEREACARFGAEAQRLGLSYHFHPAALWRQAGRVRLHHLAPPFGPSLLEPDVGMLRRFRADPGASLSDQMAVVRVSEVDAVALTGFAAASGLPAIDFMKLNVQGAELAVLEGMGGLLQDVLGLQIEMWFRPGFRHAPSFSVVDEFLQRQGFVCFDMLSRRTAGRNASPLVLPEGRTSHSRWPSRQTLSGQFLYLRDPIGPSGYGEDWALPRVLKLAMLAELYGQCEFAFELLNWLARRSEGAVRDKLEKLLTAAVAEYRGSFPSAVVGFDRGEVVSPPVTSPLPPHGPNALFATVCAHIEAGRIADAERLCRELLEQVPDHADGWHTLGFIAGRAGRHDDADTLIRRAMHFKRDVAEYHNSLGASLRARDLLPQAVAEFEQATHLKPDYVDALCNLGNVLLQMKQSEAAAKAYAQGLALAPNYAEMHYNLAIALQNLGKTKDAEHSYRQALVLKPELAAPHNNLGILLQAQGKFQEAQREFEQVIALAPNYAEAYNNLGLVLRAQGRPNEAIKLYQQALAIKFDYAEAHYNLGITYYSLGRLTEAEGQFRCAVAIKPNYSEAYNDLGNVFQAQGMYADAVIQYERALAINPSFIQCLSNILFTINYDDSISNEALAQRHFEIGTLIESRATVPAQARPVQAERTRRLRIGYVSPDFRNHAVAFYLEPMLRCHDRTTVEVFCYSEVAQPDPLTEGLRLLADGWFSTIGVSDDDVAERIRSDRIDILVDLAGHTANNRLAVFARKPAPVQVNWLGYGTTTGLTRIDYRLTDRWLTPDSGSERFSEKLWRLPRCSFLYRPLTEVPPCGPLPMDRNGILTFGSFNNFTKVGERTVALWSQVMLAIPGSRLFLKGQSSADAKTIAKFERLFAAHGIVPARLTWLAYAPNLWEHLRQYNEIDICLDPLPFNGGTTTCEAMWMGVPVITLAGERMVSRFGLTFLAALGLEELAATCPDELVNIACGLTARPDRLRELHKDLRGRMAASSLCDAFGFTRAVENAFRDMWTAACGP